MKCSCTERGLAPRESLNEFVSVMGISLLGKIIYYHNYKITYEE